MVQCKHVPVYTCSANMCACIHTNTRATLNTWSTDVWVQHNGHSLFLSCFCTCSIFPWVSLCYQIEIHQTVLLWTFCCCVVDLLCSLCLSTSSLVFLDLSTGALTYATKNLISCTQSFLLFISTQPNQHNLPVFIMSLITRFFFQFQAHSVALHDPLLTTYSLTVQLLLS